MCVQPFWARPYQLSEPPPRSLPLSIGCPPISASELSKYRASPLFSVNPYTDPLRHICTLQENSRLMCLALHTEAIAQFANASLIPSTVCALHLYLLPFALALNT